MNVSGIVAIYPPFPNKWERALILLMQDGKIITFPDQTIFKNNLAFKRSMNFLHDLKIVTYKTDGRNQYKLTELGEDIAKILRFMMIKNEL